MEQVCHKCGKTFEHPRPRFWCKECFIGLLPKRSREQVKQDNEMLAEAQQTFGTLDRTGDVKV